MTTPSLTNPDPKREGANQARHLTVNEPTEHANDAIYVHDEDDNDIATFFHSEHATVGQSYETALRLATLLVEANNGGGAPSPGDPVRAALEALKPFAAVAAHDIGEDEHDKDFFRAMERNNHAPKLTVGDFRRALAALSVSTPTGEGEARRHPWCQPGDDAKRRWLVYFEDTEKGFSVFEDEAEAREFFDKADGGGWNCYLFAAAPRQPAALANPQQGGERVFKDGYEKGVLNYIGSVSYAANMELSKQRAWDEYSAPTSASKSSVEEA